MKNHSLPVLRLFTVCALVTAAAPWASAEPSVKGVPNFHVVNNGVLRGGQPSGAGFKNLADMGVTTIIDLQEEGSRAKDEKKLVKALGMRYVNIPMKGMTTPKEKQISHALKALEDNSKGPVFIHCKRGADRTGVVIACYRIRHDGWDNKKALSEARGYGMSWYQFPLQRYVSRYEPDDHGDLTESVRDGTVELGKKAARGLAGILDRVRD